MDPCAAHYFSGTGDWLVILAAVILAAMIVGLYIGWNVMKALDDGGWLDRR